MMNLEIYFELIIFLWERMDNIYCQLLEIIYKNLTGSESF